VALSAFRARALPPEDSISRASWRAFSSELDYVNAAEAPSAASRRTMPAPIPFEPSVTRAILPVSDLVSTAITYLPFFDYVVLDDSVQNGVATRRDKSSVGRLR
jgi:hypothetical protein